MLLDDPTIAERLFFPRRAPLAQPFMVQCDGAELACHRRPASAEGSSGNSGHRTFVHFHGNGEVVADYVDDYVAAIAELGLEVFMAEYRGYGGSTGSPAAARMLDDVDAIFAAVARPAEQVVVYGRSIGSIYAIELARRQPGIAGLIIESGIADVLERLLVRITPRELGVSRAELEEAVTAAFDHRSKLAAYTGPLLVMHARDDDLIDVRHAEQNYEWAGGAAKELVLFERGGHNAIMAANWPEYIATIERFVGGLPAR
ncbi:MAG: alpha/beta hydrolase [Myxococcota bacterium]